MAHARTWVQVRERSFLDILDLALLLIRRRPFTLGVAALAGIAPWALLNHFVFQLNEPDSAPLLLFLMFLEAPLAVAPLTIVLGGLMFGRRPPVGEVVRILVSSLPQLFAFQIVLRAFIVFSFILVPLLPTRLAFLNEVILLERGPWSQVFSRSTALSQDRDASLLGQWILELFLGSLFVIFFWMASVNAWNLVAGRSVWESPPWERFIGWRPIIGLWLALAYFAVVRFLTYIDQRIRLEGWEVELRLRSVGTLLRAELEE